MDTTKRSCDILLNNFQIKKKRYRVLLNYDHIVWERWNAKCRNKEANEKATSKKETEFEHEHLSNKAHYDNNSHVVHINEIVRVCKGDTKSASLNNPNQSNDIGFENPYQTDSTASSPTIATPTITPTAQYLTIYYAERIVKSPTDCNRWKICNLTLFNADPYIIAQWHSLLNIKLHENPQRLHMRRLLVFINPYGGRKEGLQTYERYCKPIFQLAGIDASCVISQRANQIRDIIMSHDLTLYDAVCCVGGDGTAAEVINGLIFRTMQDRGLDIRRPPYIPKPALPIGIIPAGSTDTIAYSVHGTGDARTAAIHIILGQRRGCDICSVRNRQGIVRFCASVFSYGYLGDVAAGSEKCRWMGTKRYEYNGFKAFLANRGYEAEIHILEQTPEDENDVEARTSRSTLALDTVCYANCQRCSSIISKSNIESNLEFDDNQADNFHCSPEKEIGNETLQTTNSNWTLSTEKSIANDFTNANNVPGIEDVIDKAIYETPDVTPEHVEAIKDVPKDMTNCDKNLENDFDEKYAQIKAIIKCDTNKPAGENIKVERKKEIIVTSDIAPDATTIASGNSFSFCSTNSTLNNNPINDLNNEMPTASVPTTPTPLSSSARWKVLRGTFFMINCANITCACARCPNGIARFSHLGDGQLDVILVRKTNMFNNVRFVLNTMALDGDIRNLPFVEIYRTRQFHFRAKYGSAETDETMRSSTQPIAEAFTDDVADNLVSSWNCDGEVIHDLDITMTSHCQLVDVFMRGPYSYTKPLKGKKYCLCCCP